MCRLDNRAIAVPTGLNPFAVDARGTRSYETPLSRLLLAVVVDVFEVESVYVTGQIAVEKWSPD